MNRCDRCEKYGNCNYTKVLDLLTDNIGSGISESKAPFICDINCIEFVNAERESMIPIYNDKNHVNNIILRYMISREIRSYHLLNIENPRTLTILYIHRISKDVYMVIGYVDTLKIYRNNKDLHNHLYMNVYIVDTMLYAVAYHVKEYRLNLTQAKYMHEIDTNSVYYNHALVLRPDLIDLLVYLLSKNHCELYSILCSYANSYIYKYYGNMQVNTINYISDMPDYNNLLTCNYK